MILEIEKESTRSHPVENSLCKGLRTCRKTDNRMNEYKLKYFPLNFTTITSYSYVIFYPKGRH
jgi:hypothetical protein